MAMLMTRIFAALLLGMACPMSNPCLAAEPKPPSPQGCQASAKDMQWWRAARFGLFVHWGPVTLKGTEISWSRDAERRGRSGGRPGVVPASEYDALYRQFNPTQFNAVEWVALAKSAGMKYLVFTTKHHDGFCMFDSQLTDYKITSPDCPFGRDVVAELARACHQAGIRLGFYYSPVDWHQPDYRTENHARYVQYLHGQVRELCSNYGKVDVIWWDGLGGTAQDWDSTNLCRMIHQLQPGIILNDRAGLQGDYDTPERRIGRFDNARPWESCLTMGEQWSWKPDDEIKSAKQSLLNLIRCAGADGNLLYNVGPTPTGQIEPRQAEVLKAMGQWLKRYGKSVYSTRGGPFKPGPWGVSTFNGKTVYVHVLNWPEDGKVVLPAIEARVLKSSVLGGGTARVTSTSRGIELEVPRRDRQEMDTIVMLKLDRDAGLIQAR